ECARNAERNFFLAGLQGAGRAYRILRLQRGNQRGAIDAQAGEFLGRELDDDLFILGAENLDLGNIRHLQQPRANLLDIVAQFTMREAVGGESIDDPEGVTELVVEAGADDAGWQRVADVADALANLIPDVGHVPGRRAPLQVHENRRDAGAGVAAQEIEAPRFLPPALHALRHLIHRSL